MPVEQSDSRSRDTQNTVYITATSSTEAEFLAAVFAAKVAMYLWCVLFELGYVQMLPTQLFTDNASAINMINAAESTDVLTKNLSHI